MIANVLFDEAVGVVAADHGIGQVHVFDLGLQACPDDVLLILRPKMTVILFGLADCSISIKQAAPRGLSSAARRRKMRLSQNSICEKNKPMLTACLPLALSQ